MDEEKYTVLLYYKYTEIAEPELLAASQRELCTRLALKGRILVAQEGINATLEGLESAIVEYVDEMKAQELFADIHFKKSDGDGTAFPKLSVKVREEIVSGHLGTADVNPTQVTGKYISAEELHELINSDEEFYIVDMRNDYEYKVGYFENSILPGMKNFRDLPQIIKDLEQLRDKKIVTVCTGGVRCEKASGYLVQNNFRNVYQLHGGIHTYMERYPNEDFLGKLYVFDGRITVGFNIESPEHKVVGKCELCNVASDLYRNCAYPRCNKHFICCDACLNSKGQAYCSTECAMIHPEYEAAQIAKTENASLNIQ